MAMGNPAQAYQSNSVNTANPSELTLMLYNGAIKFIKQTKSAILEKNMPKANEYNIRVQDIISELIITLNRDISISDQLIALYDYMQRRMIEANTQKSIEILDEVEGLFVQFRDTWKEAIVLAKKQA